MRLLSYDYTSRSHNLSLNLSLGFEASRTRMRAFPPSSTSRAHIYLLNRSLAVAADVDSAPSIPRGASFRIADRLVLGSESSYSVRVDRALTLIYVILERSHGAPEQYCEYYIFAS